MEAAVHPSLRSMTGFGVGRADLDSASVVVEARSVNHRFFDARIRLPPNFTRHGPPIESMAKSRLVRGRVEISARLEHHPAASEIQLDHARARSAFRQLEALRDELAPDRPVPLDLLGAVPELFVTKATFSSQNEDRILEAATAALEELDRMRADEGSRLGGDLHARLDLVRTLVARAGAQASGVVTSAHSRLKERLGQLLGGQSDTEPSIEQGRLETEIAILADRSDVSEELVRLESHIDQLGGFLMAGGAVGRSIDFLLQEMNREVNTIGSKSADVPLAHVVVELKTELERIREQVQNLV